MHESLRKMSILAAPVVGLLLISSPLSGCKSSSDKPAPAAEQEPAGDFPAPPVEPAADEEPAVEEPGQVGQQAPPPTPPPNDEPEEEEVEEPAEVY